VRIDCGISALSSWVKTVRNPQRTFDARPKVQVEPGAIVVQDGRVRSSAGVTTGIGLALALIEEDCGRDVAISAARMLVVYLKRAGGQSQYRLACRPGKSGTFAQFERWIAENLKADLKVEALAEQVHMSPRNFARVYAKQRGQTPAKAVDAIRVKTCVRLESRWNERSVRLEISS
jgi:transcriptional regulator GlxA family with amidase domain